MKTIGQIIMAAMWALGLSHFSWAVNDFIQPVGSKAGGTELIITNCSSKIGNGSDITNVVFGTIGTTNILLQGTNWLKVVTPAVSASGYATVKSQSASQGEKSLGSYLYYEQALEGYPLIAGIYDNTGRLQVYRKFGTNIVYTREYCGSFYSFLRYQSGGATSKYSNAGYHTAFTAVTNTQPSSRQINCVLNAGGAQLTETLEYVNGKSYFKKQWSIVNTNSTTYTNLTFIHGGDTYFANDDRSKGYWDNNLNMVYLKNDNANGLMGFYGAYGSSADQYFEGNYISNSFNMQNFNLPNTVNTNYIDSGYSLQWNKSSLTGGEEWVITAYEKWTGEGDVQVIAGSDQSAMAGTSVTAQFTVVNFQTNSDTFNLSPSASQTGWTASLPGGTNIALATGASSNIMVHVVIGSAASCGITLTAASQTMPSVTNSDNLTVIGIGYDQTITNFLPTNGSVFVTTDSVGLRAEASSGLPVSFSVGCGPGIISGSTNLTFSTTGIVSIVASQTGSTNWNAAPDITNTFSVLPAPTPPTTDGWLAINVTPSDGNWRLTAPAGYAGPTSGTGNLAAVSAVTGGYEITYGALSGYVAPTNQTQFVTGGNTSLFAGVYLQVSTNIGTPSGINATEGTYTNKIRITWNGVSGAIGYEVWRSQSNDSSTATRIAEVSDQTFSLHPSSSSLSSYYYDDYNINPISAYYYWVRAKTAALISPMSYVGMGYASVDPHGAGGAADIGASDLVYLPANMTNNSAAGTVSCRVANMGPDALNSSGVAFDFHMGTNAANMVWIGSAQSNLTLNAGAEKLIILNSSAKRNLTARGDLRGVQTVQVTVRHLSTLNDPNPANNTATAAGTVRIKTSGVNSPGRSVNDYDGDGKADGAICATNMSEWAVLFSGSHYQDGVIVDPGETGWIAVPGDYEGLGNTGPAVYVPEIGLWYVWLPDSGQGVMFFLGGPEFTAAPCDFDGDAKTDPVVYREADGCWFGMASSGGYALQEAPGCWQGYSPVPGDYDGDGKADPAAYYNGQTGMWILGPSSMGYVLLNGIMGGPGWITTPADYDGDGKTDPAVYAPSAAYWQVLLSESLETTGEYTWWGGIAGNINGIPVPADYDGDGKSDLAVYHQDTGIWQIFLSASNYQEFSGGFGGPEYQPVLE